MWKSSSKTNKTTKAAWYGIIDVGNKVVGHQLSQSVIRKVYKIPGANYNTPTRNNYGPGAVLSVSHGFTGRGGGVGRGWGGWMSLKLAMRAIWSDENWGDGRPVPRVSLSRSSNKPSTLKLLSDPKHDMKLVANNIQIVQNPNIKGILIVWADDIILSRFNGIIQQIIS